MTRRTVFSAAAMVLGLVLVVVAVTQLHHDRRTPANFAVPAPSATATRSVPASSRSAKPTPARTPARTAPAPAVPVTLALPSLAVQATVRQVVTTNGVLGVPDNIADVGWWTGSVRPGSAAGSTVIDGHVDSAVTGTGALFHLAQLQAGDPVTLTDAAGVLRHYRVYQRQVFVKHDGLPADLFTTTGAPRLVMITCGGPFDRATRNYLDNIVVFAAPV